MQAKILFRAGVFGLGMVFVSGCTDHDNFYIIGDGEAPPPSKLTMIGQMAKGAVIGASCQAFTFTGLPLGEAGTTDASGVFTLELTPAPTQPYKVECTGGNYFNEATGQTEPFTGTMKSVAPSGTASVAVTPLTHVAAERVEDLGGAVTDGNVEAILSDISSFFGVSDILTPPQVVSESSDLDELSGQTGAYAAVLAALAILTEESGQDAQDILVILAEDIADGALGDSFSRDEIDAETAEVAEGTDAADEVEQNQDEADRNGGEVSGTGGSG